MKEVLNFLNTLKENNNREWFQANKHEYENAKSEFLSFVGELITGISKFDKSIENIIPKDCMFRIYRDTRFSSDKTPYKTNLGAFISKGGLKSQLPGYYIHIQSGECFASAGIYMPQPEALNKIRQEIFYHYNDFKSIIESTDFKKYKLQFWEDKLKRPPKGFNPEFEGIEYLKMKSFVPYFEIADNELGDNNLVHKITGILQIMYPLNVFLTKALV